jgi:phage gpG-like protein
MLAASLNGDYAASLAALPERLRDALAAKAGTLAAELQAKIQQKLMGGVLNMKSGALLRSIGVAIEETSSGVAVRIATAPDVKYAAIHEFGGTIPPHEVLPDKGRALAFLVGGKQAFAARVEIQAVTMPERSYMRSSLAEMADDIRDGVGDTVANAVQ